MNTIFKASMISTAVAMALALSSIASADTITGTLSTGISGNNGTTVNGVVVTAPIANPPAGAYTAAQSVTLTADGSDSIHYTIDGTNPTCTTGTVYSGAISVGSSEPIEAIACYVDASTSVTHPSTVASYLYAINIPSSPPLSGGSSFGGGGGGGSSGISLFSKGDSNLDGHINILDFVALMANWGQTGTGNPADFNGDGKVDILDFVILMANWTN